MIDVVVLSLLYYWRIISGSVATSIEVSAWMSIFSIFLFFSLALSKRVSELKMLEKQDKQISHGRSYVVKDLDFIQNIGISSGYISVLILALYINSEHVRSVYDSPHLLWPMCIILLYWVSHIWLQVHRGKMLSDPIVFTLKDPNSHVVAAVSVLVVVAAKVLG